MARTRPSASRRSSALVLERLGEPPAAYRGGRRRPRAREPDRPAPASPLVLSGSIRIARASSPPIGCSCSPKRTNTGPPNGWRSLTSRRVPSAMPARPDSEASPGRSPRRDEAPDSTASSSSRLRVWPSSISNSAVGIGSPWGSRVGSPSRAAISSSSSSESTCSSTSASASTRSQASLAPRRGTARAGDGGGSPPGPPACPPRSAARRGSALLDQPLLGELADHARHRAGRDPRRSARSLVETDEPPRVSSAYTAFA